MRYLVFLFIFLSISAQETIEKTDQEDIEYFCSMLYNSFRDSNISELKKSNKTQEKAEFKKCCLETLTPSEAQIISDPEQIATVLKSIGCGTANVRSKEATIELINKQKGIKSTEEGKNSEKKR